VLMNSLECGLCICSNTDLVQSSVLDVVFLVPVTVNHCQHVTAHGDLAVDSVGCLTAAKEWLVEQTTGGVGYNYKNLVGTRTALQWNNDSHSLWTLLFPKCFK